MKTAELSEKSTLQCSVCNLNRYIELLITRTEGLSKKQVRGRAYRLILLGMYLFLKTIIPARGRGILNRIKKYADTLRKLKD